MNNSINFQNSLQTKQNKINALYELSFPLKNFETDSAQIDRKGL